MPRDMLRIVDYARQLARLLLLSPFVYVSTTPQPTPARPAYTLSNTHYMWSYAHKNTVHANIILLGQEARNIETQTGRVSAALWSEGSSADELEEIERAARPQLELLGTFQVKTGRKAQVLTSLKKRVLPETNAWTEPLDGDPQESEESDRAERSQQFGIEK
ncbi:Hypothetical predicted protein [Xyrichtys novacula]|uniref:Pyridoxamine 5'-phosphate oxidase putative domain-containing protein n=1 Tax=Xyrichtys novacula TaxID=13765 RepID=A0AAV1GCP4_XYRNO|nr:Hypothetical predicted protein [Xyrichtys novacula]